VTVATPIGYSQTDITAIYTQPSQSDQEGRWRGWLGEYREKVSATYPY